MTVVPPQIVIAVTDGEYLYTSRQPSTGQPVRLANAHGARSGAGLCESCLRAGVRQLWIVGVRSEMFDWECDGLYGWDFQPARAPASWVHAVKRGASDDDTRAVDVVFPAESQDNPFREASDPAQLLNALLTYRSLMGGNAYYRSAASTAARLLRNLHTGPHTIPLDVPAGQLPPPATMMGIENPPVLARALIQAERDPRSCYLHAYDRNMAYLSAASALPVGYGACEHITDPARLHDEALLTRPGYVLVDVPECASGLSPYFEAGLHSGRRRQWVTTITYRYLQQLAATPPHEAWIWEKAHRPLDPWYRVLSNGRALMLAQLAHDPRDAVARLVLGAIKASYAGFVGYVRAPSRDGWDRSADPLYRPDIRHHIIARARCNLLYRVAKAGGESHDWPLAVADTDTLFFLLRERWPLKAAAQLPRYCANGPADLFKHKGSGLLDAEAKGRYMVALQQGGAVKAARVLMECVERGIPDGE